MSVGPRIVFVRFVTSESPKLTPWIAHTGRVIGTRARELQDAKPVHGIVVWQLVSGNSRQLARGVEIHETFEDARDNATSVLNGGPALAVQRVTEAGRGMYGWFASLDDNPVMTCARWYPTDRDSRRSIDLAIRSIPVTTLHEGARLTDPTLMAGDRGRIY